MISSVLEDDDECLSKVLVAVFVVLAAYGVLTFLGVVTHISVTSGTP